MNDPIDLPPVELTLPLERPTILAGTGLLDAVEVGRGGFGVVYRATEPALGRTVAVKLLRAGFDSDQRARFAREGRALGALSNHPNIVTVLRVGETDHGEPYLVMAYLAGGTLAERVRHDARLSPTDAAAIGEQLAAALEAAHGSGILHRDVKPENVLFGDYGDAQLGDFGIALLATEATTATHGVYASMNHAAPEVLEGGRATTASDVYSLASTLYFAVTGRSPFTRRSEELLAAYFVRVARDDPTPLRDAGVPDRLAATIHAALSKDPARRPSAAEFRAQLAAAKSLTRSDQPAVPANAGFPLWEMGGATPDSPGAMVGSPMSAVRTPRRRLRRPLVKAGVALAVLVLLGAAALLARSGDSVSRSSGPARLLAPSHVVVEDDGSIVVLDAGHNRMVRVRMGGEIEPVAGNGKPANTGDFGPAIDAGLDNPSGLARSADGSLATVAGGAIRVIDPAGTIRTVRADDGIYLAADGLVRDTRDPESPGWLVAVRGAVVRVAEDGTTTVVAGDRSEEGVSGDGGDARNARFGRISGLAIGDDGSVFVADGGSERIRRIDRDGIVRAFAGGGSRSTNSTRATDLKLSGAGGLAFDGDALIVAEFGNHRVLRIDADGGVRVIAGNPNGYADGFSGDGGPALAARFGTLRDVAVATDHTVFVVDRSNNRVRVIEPDGVVRTVA